MQLSLTVIMPAHNAEGTIGQAIASTLNQTHKDFELWILENGSTDRTVEIARSFKDARVRIFELGPVGFQNALQHAIERASSEWLARMDADDLMFPNRLQVQLEVIKQNPGVVFVGTAYALLTPFGHIFERILPVQSREVDVSTMGWGRFFADPSTVFSRTAALDAGGVDPGFSTGDVPLWFRMLQKGKGWEIARPLHLYRIQPNSMSHSADFVRQAYEIRAKYAPQTLGHYSQIASEPSSGWHTIAGLELLAGDRDSVHQVAGYIEREGFPAAAKRIRWISYLGRLGYQLFRLRNPARFKYRRRTDWEEAFAPLLQLLGLLCQDLERLVPSV